MNGILNDQGAVWEASRAQLDLTHAAVTGKPFPEHVSDAAARVRITMLILKARDHVGPGVDDVLSAVVRKGIKMENKYEPGTLAAELSAQIEPETKPRAAVKPPKRRKVTRVRAISEGERMQKKSQRYAVFTAIVAAGSEGISVADLDAQMELNTSPFIQKLLAAGHVESIEEGLSHDQAESNVEPEEAESSEEKADENEE